MSYIQNYAFIDGNYLRRAYEDSMRRWFPPAVVDFRQMDLNTLRAATGASKVFYYDSVDEQAKDAADRSTLLDDIDSLDGFHVRRGVISQNQKKQKEVDVALAVDCLTHAFNKNVWHVTLVAGDRDFKPLVDALVRLGTHVHVFYEHRSASRDLYRSADARRQMTLRFFWEHSQDAFRAAYPVPQASQEAGVFPQGVGARLKAGQWAGGATALYRPEDQPHGFMLLAMKADGESHYRLRHHDEERLLAYFELMYGEIAW